MTATMNVTPETRAAWKQARSKTLNASEVAAVLGLSKWQTPWDVWAGKTMAFSDVEDDRQILRLGHLLQPAIAEEASRMERLTIVDEEPWARHPVEQWAAATPDYLCDDRHGRRIVLECKATSQPPWHAIPDHYRTQLAWQCWVHGVDRAILAALHASTTVMTYDFNMADCQWIEDVVAVLRQWWTHHVIEGNPPPSNAKAATPELVDRIRAVPGKVATVDDEFMTLIKQRAYLKTEQDGLKGKIEEIETRLKTVMGEAEVALYLGQTVVTWKEHGRTCFDQKSFEAAFPVLAKKFRKESASRRFEFKTEKKKGKSDE